MTTPAPDFRALCEQLMELAEGKRYDGTDVAAKARAALATPAPELPTVMEILELSGEIEDAGLGQIDLVHAALERWGHG